MKSKKFGIILFIILFSYFLIIMDNSIIFTGTVKIASELGLSEAALSWVSNAYTITFGGFLLLAGRLGDYLGRKKIFLSGLIIFGLGSLAIGLSQNAIQIIIFRAIQGVGSAIIAPTSLALLMDNYKDNMRMRAISYYGATAGIGASVGLIFGGWLTSTISWRAGFLINVPFAILLAILILFKITDKTKPVPAKIDFLGAIFSVTFALLFVYGITVSNLLLIGLSILILIAFIIWESHQLHPIMPLSLFANRIRTGAYITRFTFMMAMLTYWFIVPQILQNHYGFTPLQAGMGFLPLTIVNFVGALYLPRLTVKFGNSHIMLIGQCILLVGMVLSAIIDPRNGYWLTIGLPMIFVGLGQGWLLAPLTSAGVEGVSPELAGAASGMTNTVHQIGGPVGLSIVVLFSSNLTGNWIEYYHLVMWFIVGFSTLGLVTLVLTNLGRKKTT